MSEFRYQYAKLKKQQKEAVDFITEEVCIEFLGQMNTDAFIHIYDILIDLAEGEDEAFPTAEHKDVLVLPFKLFGREAPTMLQQWRQKRFAAIKSKR